jgi:phage shock protein C
MYCTRCGTRLDDSVRFCTACGKSTSMTPSAPLDTPFFAPGAAATPKKLRRISNGKKLAGVCIGYAEYFDMDVTLMRLIWVGLLLIPPHLGLIAYLVSWAVLPKA